MLESILGGGDLRSVGSVSELVNTLNDPGSFHQLTGLLNHPDRRLAMRAADAMEKISRMHPEWLRNEKQLLLEQLYSNCPIEIRWHLAQMVPRLNMAPNEIIPVINILVDWLKNNTDSRLVRVGALQGLYELSQNGLFGVSELRKICMKLSGENIPSLNARIRKLGILNK